MKRRRRTPVDHLKEVPTRKLVQIAHWCQNQRGPIDMIKLYALLYSYPLRKDWK